uniref:Uncharacterized protein n=1 Tax=Anguilla anguilla TaxID=7936 RepID=A0A0E9UMI4_ANGAN
MLACFSMKDRPKHDGRTNIYF